MWSAYERDLPMGKSFPSLPPLRRPSIPQPSRLSIKPLTLVITLMLVLFLLGSITLSYASMQTDSTPLAGPLARFSVQLLPRAFPSPVPTSRPATPSPSPTPAASSPFLDYPLYGGNPQKPEIALTFDDGPHPYNTPQVLATLNRFGIKATFFCVGRLVAAFPELVKQEHAAGHLVEDHSWSHPYLPSLAPSAILTQLAGTSAIIYATIGVRPAFFRPPYGAFNGQVLAQARSLHLTTVIWNDDPRDWSLPGTTAIINRVLWSARNGTIIILHDGGGYRQQTIAALPTIITTLQERGFRFVTIGQLVNDLGQPVGTGW